MSFRDLANDPTFIFDGTNYDVWKIRMLNLFRVYGPKMERIVDMDFPQFSNVARPITDAELENLDRRNPSMHDI